MLYPNLFDPTDATFVGSTTTEDVYFSGDEVIIQLSDREGNYRCLPMDTVRQAQLPSYKMAIMLIDHYKANQ